MTYWDIPLDACYNIAKALEGLLCDITSEV